MPLSSVFDLFTFGQNDAQREAAQAEIDYLNRDAQAEIDYLSRDFQAETEYLNRDAQASAMALVRKLGTARDAALGLF